MDLPRRRVAATPRLRRGSSAASASGRRYDFVRPEAKPRCTAEEQSVLDCYAARKGADVLQCGPVVDAYSACARRVVDDLAASLAAAQQK